MKCASLPSAASSASMRLGSNLGPARLLDNFPAAVPYTHTPLCHCCYNHSWFQQQWVHNAAPDLTAPPSAAARTGCQSMHMNTPHARACPSRPTATLRGCLAFNSCRLKIPTGGVCASTCVYCLRFVSVDCALTVVNQFAPAPACP